MNQQPTPLNLEKARHIARKRAGAWTRVEWPTHELTYTDYIQAIAGLHVITSDADRTTAFFGAVIDQAKPLGRSSEWVQAERTVDAQAIGNWSQWGLASVKNAGAGDTALDAYKHRRDRLLPKH